MSARKLLTRGCTSEVVVHDRAVNVQVTDVRTAVKAKEQDEIIRDGSLSGNNKHVIYHVSLLVGLPESSKHNINLKGKFSSWEFWK